MFDFDTAKLRRRIEVLEKHVQAQDEVIRALCRATGVPMPQLDAVDPTTVDAVERDLVAQGRVVDAVRHHKERTGSSLKQAKQAIDGATGGTLR